MVPLAEAWDSGAGAWTAAAPARTTPTTSATRRTLVGVTASLNRSKGDQDVAEWTPPINDCRYIKEWVAAKIRWSLAQDSRREVRRCSRSPAGAPTRRITVTVKTG